MIFFTADPLLLELFLLILLHLYLKVIELPAVTAELKRHIDRSGLIELGIQFGRALGAAEKIFLLGGGRLLLAA